MLPTIYNCRLSSMLDFQLKSSKYLAKSSQIQRIPAKTNKLDLKSSYNPDKFQKCSKKLAFQHCKSWNLLDLDRISWIQLDLAGIFCDMFDKYFLTAVSPNKIAHIIMKLYFQQISLLHNHAQMQCIARVQHDLPCEFWF